MRTEREEFEGCGLEMPDLADADNLNYLTNEWGGELRFVQNIKLRRFRKEELDSGKFADAKKKQISKEESENDAEKETMETDD